MLKEEKMLGSQLKEWTACLLISRKKAALLFVPITKTYLYNFDPLKPTFI